jgi:hypothetical protein
VETLGDPLVHDLLGPPDAATSIELSHHCLNKGDD